ncbi:MAG TPA: FHA domain-containing protein [Phycisphaerae bacterium]|nr:FHA domain-containing protein [Phycisphaerae bacterium]
MASLVVTNGAQSGQNHPLARRIVSIGRDPAQDIQLTDPRVSRRHFEIRRRGERFVLTPLECVNPVRINGEAIDQDTVLCDLDAIDVGEVRLRFRLDDDPGGANVLGHMKRIEQHLREDPTINNHGVNG